MFFFFLFVFFPAFEALSSPSKVVHPGCTHSAGLTRSVLAGSSAFANFWVIFSIWP